MTKEQSSGLALSLLPLPSDIFGSTDPCRTALERIGGGVNLVEYRDNPPLDSRILNDLFSASWDGHVRRDFSAVLGRSLGYVAAFEGERLVGFVNVATDGAEHAFVLDTTVHPDFRHRGIETQLVRRAVELARRHGASWLHVDFERGLSDFYYRSCSFQPTTAGLIRL
jgi:GNAT superfamily N-acetyltransferase